MLRTEGEEYWEEISCGRDNISVGPYGAPLSEAACVTKRVSGPLPISLGIRPRFTLGRGADLGRKECRGQILTLQRWLSVGQTGGTMLAGL